MRLEVVMVKRSLEAAKAIIAGKIRSLAASVSITHTSKQHPEDRCGSLRFR
jgi:hypothetical protein